MKAKKKRKVIVIGLLILLLAGVAAIAVRQLDPQRRLARHVTKARINMNGGQLGPALTEYESALAIDPENDIALCELGFLRLAMEQPDRAEKQFQACIDLHPRYTRAWVGLIKARLALNNTEGVADAGRKLLEIERSAETLVVYGDARAAIEAYDDALGAYAEASSLNQQAFEPVLHRAALLRKLKLTQQARRDLLAYAEREGAEDREKAFATLAEMAIQDERVAEGVELLDRAAAIKPTPEIAIRRAEALCFVGRFAQGLQVIEPLFKDVAEGTTPAPRACKARALCLFETGAVDAALRDAQIAQRALMNDPQLALLVARIHHSAGREMQAEEEARRALLLSPDYTPAQNFLMMMLMEKGKYDPAITLGRSLMERPRKNEAAMRMLVRAYLASGRPDDARKTFELLRQAPKGAAPAAKPEASKETLEEIARLQKLDAATQNTASVQFMLGQALLRKGDVKGAVECLERAVQLEPQRVEAQLALINLRMTVGQNDAAVARLEQVVAANRDSLKATLWLAQIRTQQKRYKDAADLYAHALTLDPRSPEAMSGEIKNRLAAHDVQGIADAAEKMIADARPEARAYARLIQATIKHLNNEPAAAMELLDKALALAPDQPLVLHEKALNHFHEGKLAEALRCMERIEEQSPQPAGSERLDFAVVLLAAGRIPEARAAAFEEHLLKRSSETLLVSAAVGLKSQRSEDIRQAVELMPGDRLELGALLGLPMTAGAAEACLKLAEAEMYFRNGRTFLASELLKTPLQAAAESADLAAVVANTLSKMGRRNESIELMEKVAEANPKRADFAMLLAEFKRADNQNDDAIKYYRRVIEIIPDQPRAHSLAGTLLMHNGDHHAASELLVKAIKLLPHDVVSLNNYVWLTAVDLKSPQKALPFAEDLCRVAPNNAHALDTAGWVMSMNSRHDDALKTLRYAAALAPENADIACHLGLALMKANQPVEALAELKRAKALGKKLMWPAEVDAAIVLLEQSK